jgi:hypothetical protein
MIEIAKRNQFGICPRCGKHLFLLNSTYELFAMSDSGWSSKNLGKHCVSKAVCKTEGCGFKTEMKMTINGMVPKDFVGELPPKVLNPNPIGKEE